ncbi:hypothetical protein N5D37_05300 [Comamonas aquatica]|uniref:deoxynucleotide monophosphate kinase family protein n=1 Tax=Comamonas aquatica TaxID=225991 RepID=UPI002446B14B|nr:hypothetical protein [Comamonas aquatica]MDH1765124.1 hypothetical protein [Comamonas aquatica]
MLENAPIIIGLTGANGAGKDTVAGMLSRALHTHRRQSCVMAFADPLYEEVAKAFLIKIEQLKERRTKEQPSEALNLNMCIDPWFVQSIEKSCNVDVMSEVPRSPRQILQWWGTQYRRAQDPLYWVKRFEHRVRQHQEAGIQHIVVTDVRFADEAATIRALVGQIWRVHRPNLPASGTGHVSEVTGLEFDPEATILNSGSLDALHYATLQTLFNSHMRKAEAP